MNSSNRVLLILFLGIFSCKSNVLKSDSLNQKNDLDKERLKLRKYSFCKCTNILYEDSLQIHLRDNSQVGFFEFSAYDKDVFTDLRPVIKNWIYANKKNYISKEDGANLTQMICFDFFYSSTLDSFINKQDKKINKRLLELIKQDDEIRQNYKN